MSTVMVWIPSIVQWMMEISFMATVMAFLILVIRSLLKHRLPIKWQYGLWLLLIVRLLLPWAPESSVSLFNIFPFMHQDSWQAPIKPGHSESNLPGEPQEYLTSILPTNPHASELSINEETDKTAPLAYGNVSLWKDTAIFIVWSVGVLIFGMRFVKVHIEFSRGLKKTPRIPAESHQVELLDRCRQEIGVKRSIPLWISTGIAGPVLYGLVRPRILLPAHCAETFSSKELRYIFLHELVHMKRKDIAVNVIMTLLLIVQWFNPVLWYAYRKMREDQELSCDAAAISHIGTDEVKEYGYTIVKLLESSASRPSRLLASANFSRGHGELKRRMKMIAKFKRQSFKWSVVGLSMTLLLVAVSLTNAKAADVNPVNPDLAKEIAKQESLHASVLSEIDPKIRGQVEDTVRNILMDLGEPLPLKKVEHVPKNQQWFLEFEGDGTGMAYVWVDDKNGKFVNVSIGVDLPLNRVEHDQIDQAVQALEKEGYTGKTDFKVHRVIDNLLEGGSYSVQTTFSNSDAQVVFTENRIRSVFFKLDPEQVTEEHQERGRQALSLFGYDTGAPMTSAYRLVSDREEYINLQYEDGSHITFHPETLKISQIGFQSKENIDHKDLNITEQKLTETAKPLATALFHTDLRDYTLTMHPNKPGTASFHKPGEPYIHLSYNASGEIYLWTINDAGLSR